MTQRQSQFGRSRGQSGAPAFDSASIMSSLAGALVPWNTDTKPVKRDTQMEPDQDEEMDDLFGNEDADMSKPDE